MKEIEKDLLQGLKKGIIWHTQGSGKKTALAFFAVHVLTDYYRKQGVIPKFYFIVDRIDLLQQASREFLSRGLCVHHVDSREEFAQEIKQNIAVHNDEGKPEITVVNIQRFKDDTDVVRSTDYAIGLQRVYFLDEVHRSYNPQGSFLANLNQSDRDAVKIGLTGTPLLNASIPGTLHASGERSAPQAFNSKVLFGDYIHKYYYNQSIADGYTLRLIREAIETQYKLQLQETLAQIKVLHDPKNRTSSILTKNSLKPMLAYIIDDFEKMRATTNDNTLGAMVICDSSEQAKEMAKIFEAKYSGKPAGIPGLPQEIEELPQAYIAPKRTVQKYALILHDVGTKGERKTQIEDFKQGKIDILFVFNMLLTGFDANRLKKLYLGRVIKAHNLLQALTRVNRPYKEYR